MNKVSNIVIFNSLQVVFSLLRTKLILIVAGISSLGLFSLYNGWIELIRSVFSIAVEDLVVINSGKSSKGFSDSKFLGIESLDVVALTVLGIGLVGVPVVWFFYSASITLYSCVIIISASLISARKYILVAACQGNAEAVSKRTLIVLLVYSTSFLIILWLFKNVILSLLISSAILFLFTKKKYIRKAPLYRVGNILKALRLNSKEIFGLTILSFIGNFALVILRQIIVFLDSVDSVAIFQTSFTFCNILSNLFITIVTGQLLYKFAQSTSSSMDDYLKYLRKVLIPSAIILAIVGVLTPVLLRTLFTKDFLVYQDLFRLYLFASFVRILVWPIRYLLIARKRTYRLLATEATVYLSLILPFVLYRGEMSMNVFPILYAIGLSSWLFHYKELSVK